MIKLSIVLLTWNAAQHIRPCLDSLLPQVPEKTEFIIIDNGSTDDSRQIIQRHYPEMTLIVNEENRGVGPARNQGLRLAKGQYILVLDIDTVAQPGAIAHLLQGMEDDRRVGLTAAKLVSPQGELQYTCRNFPTVWSKLFRQIPSLQDRLLQAEELRLWDHTTRQFVGYVIGACQMIRRQAMEQVGFYDEHIFYGPEDVDYCLRMWRGGWRVLYNPDAVIWHLERRVTRKKIWRNYLFWVHLKGLVWYFWRHKYLFRAPRFEDIAESSSSY
ncbi:MAG: glycosyltransferase family 2 protein [Anaerolineae bacterium]|nr:glycosyltransferase family 2 protein [Anaerolineae bacterium]